MARNLGVLLSLSGRQKACMVPAWLLLGASRLVILWLPFRHLAGWLGTPVGVSAWTPIVGYRDEGRAAAIGRVVQTAAAWTPWESNCLSQAVTARALLGFCGISCSVFFGVSQDVIEGKLEAHAWVAAGRVPVTGGVNFDRFTVVGCFVAAKIPRSQLSIRVRDNKTTSQQRPYKPYW